MKIKHLKETKYIIVIFTAMFLLINVPMALAKMESLAAVYLLLLEFGPDQKVPKDPVLLSVYLPAILAASVEREGEEEDGTLESTGNFLLDYKQAIDGLSPNRFSLEEVVRRYNEMKYDALVCMQVSYYHLDGGPFDKIIINDKLYDVLVIERLPKRWNHGPFLIDNTGQCKNWP